MAKVKILVVEDEAITAKDLQDKLRGLGYDVPAIAASGEGAIKKAEEIKPDLVLMDIILKGDMDGIEAAVQIRDRFDIPVVYVTAYIDDARVEKTKATAPFGYIVKPFEDKDLRPAIEMALQRHKLEKALRESEERYRMLFNNSNDAVFVHGQTRRDMPGKLIEVNDIACQKFGYTREELLKLSHLDLIAHEQLEEVPKIREKLLPRGHIIFEITAVTKDGKKFPCEISTHLFEFKGQPTVFSILRDITERKLAEEALREERDKAQKYLDVAEVMFVIIGADQKVPLVNNKCCGTLGYKEEEIIGKNWFDNFIPERIKDEVKTVFQKLMAGEIELTEYFENLILTKSGEERIIAWHNTVLRDKAGNIIGTLSSGEDITERKRMEDALRESEGRFRALTESTSDWIWEVDENAVYTYTSPKIKELLGYEPEEIIGKTPFDLMTSEGAKRVAAEFGAIAEGQKSFDGLENENLHKDGQILVLETSAIPIFDANGNFRGYRGIDRDITERKRAEEELEEKNEALKRFNKLAVGRELRMIELKKEINALIVQLGEEPRYEIAGES